MDSVEDYSCKQTIREKCRRQYTFRSTINLNVNETCLIRYSFRLTINLNVVELVSSDTPLD